MKKIIKYITITFFVLSSLYASSIAKSMFMPGWGEQNEYNILSKDKSLDEISYIEKRSKRLFFSEAIVLSCLFLSSEFFLLTHLDEFLILDKP